MRGQVPLAKLPFWLAMYAVCFIHALHLCFSLNQESFLSESNKVVKALMVGGFEAYI
jgi:hypothetical protein